MTVSFWEDNKKFTIIKNDLRYPLSVVKIIILTKYKESNFLSTCFTYHVNLKKIFQTENFTSPWYSAVYVFVTTYFLNYPEINNTHNVGVGGEVVFHSFQVSRKEWIYFSLSELNVYSIQDI